MMVAPMAPEVATEPLTVYIILDGLCPQFNLVILCHLEQFINVVTALLK
jgi:hypothetical protein